MPAGVPFRSAGWQSIIARHRWSKVKSTQAAQEYNALADCWDTQTSRFGDQAGGVLRQHKLAPGEVFNTHRKTITTAAAVRMSFQGLIRASVPPGEVALNGTRRTLEVMLGVGALALAAWKRAASQAESTAGGNKVTYVRRHEDVTPMYLGFRSLHQQLQPQARYLRPLEADRPGGLARWVTCTFEEFKKWQPPSRPLSGILEVFGRDAEVTTAIGDGDHPDVKTQRRIYPPNILARGNASCIHSAVGGASTSSLHFPVQKIKRDGNRRHRVSR